MSNAADYTLYTIHCTLYTVHPTLYNVNNWPYLPAPIALLVQLVPLGKCGTFSLFYFYITFTLFVYCWYNFTLFVHTVCPPITSLHTTCTLLVHILYPKLLLNRFKGECTLLADCVYTSCTSYLYTSCTACTTKVIYVDIFVQTLNYFLFWN